MDWGLIGNLATGAGTLVLAVATFGSVRSANRAARVAERAMLQGMRPVLVPTAMEDRDQKVMWGDQHWARVSGGRASVEVVDGNVYLAFSLRNVGNGLAVLQSWQLHAPHQNGREPLGELAEYRPHSRDLYVPVGDLGFWQAGLRDPNDPLHLAVRRVIERREPFSVDVLYTDHEGGQRMVSRFGVYPGNTADRWLVSVSRHWHLDNEDPHVRPQPD